MNMLENLRALVDKTNKANAKNKLPTGGDGRTTQEMLNTSAIARAHGAQRAIPRTLGHVPLSELIKNSKQT